MGRLHAVNGQIFMKNTDLVGESHIYGQYAGPYWFEKALRVNLQHFF